MLHKLMLKIFGFFKSGVTFLQALILFIVLLFLLFWIENIISADFGWLNFARPLLNTIASWGTLISDNSETMAGIKFEYKYPYTVLILLIIYLLIPQINKIIKLVENIYFSCHDFVKNTEEQIFNSSLDKDHSASQKKIQQYFIYVETSIKKDLVNINLEEQNIIMNKFLMEKTGINPTKFEAGFLYEFSTFDKIDDTLKIFFKLLHSTAPLNYKICVQILETNRASGLEKLKTLIGLDFVNKISMTSDTAFRYSFNNSKSFEFSQLGIYQKNNKTFEAMEFVEI